MESRPPSESCASTTPSTSSSSAPNTSGATSLAPITDSLLAKNGHANAITPNIDATISATTVRGPTRDGPRRRGLTDRGRREDAGALQLLDGEPGPGREDLRDLRGERGRRHDHVGGRAVGHDLALGHHHDPVRGLGDELHVVGRHRDRVAAGRELAQHAG